MQWPIEPHPASFLCFVYPGQASTFAAPHLGHPPCPCLLQDHLSEGLSGRPEEVLGGSSLANPGLRNGTSPSAPSTQVKYLWVCATPPKLDVSTWPSRKLNQDEILR